MTKQLATVHCSGAVVLESSFLHFILVFIIVYSTCKNTKKIINIQQVLQILHKFLQIFATTYNSIT